MLFKTLKTALRSVRMHKPGGDREEGAGARKKSFLTLLCSQRPKQKGFKIRIWFRGDTGGKTSLK